MRLVFVVGTGRCGSTLVHEVLAKHPAFGFVSNIEDALPGCNRLGRWNNALFRSALGNFSDKRRLRFAPSEAYRVIAREVSPIYADSARDLRAEDVTPWLEGRFKDFFESRAKAQRRDDFLHKYTGWPRMDFFARIFPEARFIHIVRDGRAVANSWLQMPWWGGYRGPEHWHWGPLSDDYAQEWERNGHGFPLLAALAWKTLMESFQAAEVGLEAHRYLRLRLEDILDAPSDQFQTLLEFCDLASTPSFERSLARRKFRSDRNRAFERDLSAAQLSAIEDSLAPLLERYGYV